MEELWLLVKARADNHGETGATLSMADARWQIVEMSSAAKLGRPTPEALEYLASELLRLTQVARESRRSSFRRSRRLGPV